MSNSGKFRKLVCTKLANDFEKAVEIVTVDRPKPRDNEVIVKNRYVGVNAFDICITSGVHPNFKTPPFDVGFEAIGEVLEVGSNVKKFKIGEAVGYISMGSYADIVCLPEETLISIPNVDPKYLSLLICGLTAAICFDQTGDLKAGEKVLITAAAGGTGQLAVQWAKKAGCHVLGMCSTKEKADFIKNLGCDFVINYKEEDLDQVLLKHYPNGLDVIWETIGGKTFEVLTKHIAPNGRMLLLGSIDTYKTVGIGPVDISHITAQLIFTSASLRGFTLLMWTEHFAPYFARLTEMLDKGQLIVKIDQGETSPGGVFRGLEEVPRALQYLHSGRSYGKVIVKIED